MIGEIRHVAHLHPQIRDKNRFWQECESIDTMHIPHKGDRLLVRPDHGPSVTVRVLDIRVMFPARSSPNYVNGDHGPIVDVLCQPIGDFYKEPPSHMYPSDKE